jgi:hypothetical protein
LDFNLNYEQGFTLPLPHLAQFRRTAQKFSAAALYDLHEKRLDAAFTNLMALMALAKAPADERLIISELVRISVAQIAMAVTWEALQAPGWTDKQLERLQKEWQKLQFATAMENSFVMERAMAEEEIKRFRWSADQFNKFLGTMTPGPRPAPPGSGSLPDLLEELVENTGRLVKNTASHCTWRWYWSYEDELRLLRVSQLMIDSARMARTTPSYRTIRDGLDSHLKALGVSPEANEDRDFYGLNFDRHGLRFMFSQGALSHVKALRRAMTSETARELTVAAIALKRYQLRHGQPAHRWVTLLREFLEEPPRDYMDGKPLRYRLNADGSFILYSVGEDGQDDGGDPTGARSDSKAWSSGRDWVWPQPATQEEVAAFNAKFSK